MTRTYAAVFSGARAACKFRHAIAGSVLRPQSLELVAAGAGIERLGERAGLSFEADRSTVIVSVAGNEEVLERNRRELEALAQSAGGRSLEWFQELSGDEREKASAYVRDFPDVVLKHAPSAVIFKISQLPATFEGFAEDCKSLAIPWAVMMRGLGPTYLALLLQDVKKDSMERLQSESARVLLSGKTLRTFSLLFAPTEVKSDPQYLDGSRNNLSLMRNLKKAFDPSGVLSPGRMEYEI